VNGQPTAGWYQDPGRPPGELRYWGGTAWTEHTAVPPPDNPPVADHSPPEDESSHRPSGLLGRFGRGRKAKAESRASFEALALAAAQGDDDALGQLPTALSETRESWRAGKLEDKLWEVFSVAVRGVIADDVMTTDEESRLQSLASAMGLSLQELRDKAFPLFEEVVIAGINDGRFPTMDEAPIILKKGETAYGSFGCSLMKEVARRQFQAGTQSVSIPLGAGVRYRVGGIRGKSVVVGTDLVADDGGVLCVTSTRCVFTGQKKTLEFRHDKLVGMQQYADGFRLNVSNRQTASLFKMNPGESASVAAALISAAVAHQA
jgi:hypothetical protein